MRTGLMLLLFAAMIHRTACSQDAAPVIVDQTGTGFGMMGKVAFGGDGKWLATADQYGKVRVYDLEGGRLAKTLDVAPGNNAIHPTKLVLAAVTPGGEVQLYDLVSGKVLWNAQAGTCNLLQFTADGLKLFAGCREQASGRRILNAKAFIKGWDAETGRELPLGPMPEGIIYISAFSTDGKWYVGSRVPSVASQIFRSRNNTTPQVMASVIDLESGKKIIEVPGFTFFGLSSQAHLAVGMTEAGVVSWDTNTGKQSSLVPANLRDVNPYAIGFSPDGTQLVLAGASLTVVDFTTGQARRVAAEDLPMAFGAGISPDRDHVALAQAGGVLLLSISNPADRRLIGNPATQMLNAKAMPTPAQGSYSSLSQRERQKLIADYSRKIEKAKPAERQRLTEELNRLMKEPEEQKEAAEKQAIMESISKFGGLTAVDPVVSFLASGRMLAVLAADAWWDVWDVTTGNRLPFRKSNGDLNKLPNRSEDLLNLPALRELEVSLTGKAAPPPSDAQNSGGGEIACLSHDRQYRIEIVRQQGKVKAAIWRSLRDGRSFDLLAAGADLKAWEERPVTARSAEYPFVCSMSRDGARVIVEGIRPGEKMQRSRFARVMMPKMEDNLGKSTVDELIMYDTQTGHKLCELENAPGKTSFDVFPNELQFSPDGQLIVGGGNMSNLYRNPTGVVRGSLFLWDAPTCKQLPPVSGEAANLIGFSEDGSQFYTAISAGMRGGDNYGVRAWDATTASLAKGLSAKALYDIPDAPTSASQLRTTAKGTVFMGADRDHALSFWDRRNGEKLGTLRALQEGEWLVTTPSGLFDGSPRAWSTIAWRDSSNGISTQPGEIFFNEFYRPGLLAELLEGRKPPAPRTIAQVDRRQPTVSLTTASPITAERTVTVQIAIEEAPATTANARPSGARDLRLFRNGSLVKAWRGNLTMNQGRAAFEAVVPIRSGENRLTAYVFNQDNVKSQDALLLVQSGSARRQGTVYILSIGVNRYANPEFNLNFAVPDARRMAEMLAQTQQELGAYSKVTAVNLLDDKATRANVLLALARMGGQQRGPLPAGAPAELAALERVEPEDTVVVYFAGHGTASGDRFYLIPHDLGYSGPRDNLRNSLQSVLDSSISDQDLERAFEPVDGANLMLIIDACNSGKALDTEDDRRGPLNSKGLAQLAYEKGMFVLTAAQAYQAALESSRLGHGYLTYALAEEGLTTSAADVKPADGRITAIEWFEYATRRVPQLQMEALQEAAAQKRLLVFDGTASPDAAAGRLQTPRLYYRRDDSTAAPVVAKR